MFERPTKTRKLNIVQLALVFMYYPLCLSQITGHHHHTKQPFTSIFMCRLLFQICQGVHVLHSKWLLHRDLKPSNIIIYLSGGGCAKLCDFGLSKLFGQCYQSQAHRQQKEREIVTLYYRDRATAQHRECLRGEAGAGRVEHRMRGG